MTKPKRHFKTTRGFVASVAIDLKAETITVRPCRSRETYTLPLAQVAEMIMWRVAKQDSGHAADLQPRRRLVRGVKVRPQ